MLSHPSAEAFPALGYGRAGIGIVMMEKSVRYTTEIEQRLYAFVYSHSMLLFGENKHMRDGKDQNQNEGSDHLEPDPKLFGLRAPHELIQSGEHKKEGRISFR